MRILGRMPTQTHSPPPWRTTLRLWPFTRPHAAWLGLGIVVAAAEAGLNIAVTFLVKQMTDAALASQAHTFVYYLKWMIGAIGLGLLIAYVGRVAGIRISAFPIRDLQNRLTAHLQNLPLAAIERYHSGDLVSRFNSDAKRLEGLVGSIPGHVYQPLLFAGAFSYMLILSWKLLLVSFVLMPISIIASDRLSRPVEKHARRQREFLAEGNAVAQDAIGGVAIIKAFQLQAQLVRKYVRAMSQVQHESLQISRLDAYGLFVQGILRFIPQLVLPVYGGYLIVQGELTVGGLLACASLMWHVFVPVEAFLGFVRQMRETAPSAARLWEIEDLDQEAGAAQPFVRTASPSPVRFSNVSFRYGQDSPLLDDISFVLRTNAVTALVGSSGCGKSTLLKLLCLFYTPDKGTIDVWGNDTRQVDAADVRAQFALVSQDTYLFSATIAENIAYGRAGAQREEVEQAARAAHAHAFIQDLPQGYDTPVGERGIRLSGGQRQRIAIARAVVKDAPILLLDEPTSALDTEAEAIVEEALRALMHQRTVLMIAHRLSTIQHAEHVLVMDAGRIVESGTHSELLQQDGVYQKLYMKQVAEGGHG